MRYLIEFSYDGSKFYGFQRLNDQPTVQKRLEEALTKINKSPVMIKGAGRTDRGVHAKGQCAHFDLHVMISSEGLLSVLNKMVGPYIYITKCRTVSSDFHARFLVKEKTYRYRIYLGKFDPFLFDYYYECSYGLDVDLMKQASKYFLGGHNFENFVSGERDHYNAMIYQIDFQMDGEFLDIIFVGKSFYRYMVRNLVGALIDVGRGKRKMEDIKTALNVFPYVNRFSTAPSNGLYLEKIRYEDN